MNRPPSEFIRVDHVAMRAFIEETGQRAGLAEERARLLAQLLTDNDLRGVFSHGTIQMATYSRLLKNGILNPNPDLQVLRETDNSIVVDGDGGLGYFPAYEATQATVAKAKAQGIAIGQSRNHGHFGAAGIYTRLLLGHDLLGHVTSGHQLNLQPGQPYVTAAGGSPHSFVAPANEEEPLLLDFGAVHDLYVDSPHREEISQLAPGTVFRAVGLGAVCQAWGGFLAGVPVDPTRAQRTWPGANQGALIMAFRIDLFMDPVQFKTEMDDYQRQVHRLQPLAGFDASLLPGTVEAQRTAAYTAEGIPVGTEHRARLTDMAVEFGVATPW